MDTVPQRAKVWTEATLGARVVSARRLTGGLDALTLRVGLADDRVVTLRLLPDPEIAARQPVTIDRALLHALSGHGLPVPEVLGADVEGSSAGCPALILSWMEGAPSANLPDPVGAARQLIGVLEQVHALDPAPLAWLRHSTAGERVLGEPWPGLDREPLGDALWLAMRAAAPPADRPLVPTHGDPWLGNVIWQGATLSGLIDWSDACLNDPAADLALVRLDVAIAAGPEAAHHLPAAEHQRFWDLWGLTVWLAHFETWTQPLLDLGSSLSPDAVRSRLRTYGRFLLDT